MITYEKPEENAAYMQGYVSGRRATGEDWVRARLEKDEAVGETRKAWSEMWLIAEAAQRRIADLEEENEMLRSKLLAYQVACRALVAEDLEAGRRL